MGNFLKRAKNKLVTKARISIEFVKTMICFPFGKSLCKKREIYIVSERGTDARDNGYHMFKYLTQQHPELEVYYIIDKHSPDRHKVEQLGSVIFRKSWKHYLYFVGARYKISTHVMGYAPGVPYEHTQLWKKHPILPGKHIFLQHGVINTYIPSLDRKKINVDLFICGAKQEYDFIKEKFGHPEGVVCYTGLARYDNLHGHTTKDQILVMPTWRTFLANLSREEFLKTDYYKTWSSVLKDQRVLELLKEKGLKLYFYPHYEMQKYIDCFEVDDPNVVIAEFAKHDVQQLLIDSKLLITDYSSVYFDFAYMRKPCIYYRFDTDSYNAKHYTGETAEYNSAFGDSVSNAEEFICSLETIFKRNFVPEQKYTDKMESFFELYDDKNCERIYQAIERLK